MAVRPDPDTATDVPAGPLDGDSEIAGPLAARLEVNGMSNAAATTTIVAVAIQSRHRDWRLRCGAATSGTHWVPSQKDNVVLRSATRLTQ